MKSLARILAILLVSSSLFAQNNTNQNKFRQLGQEIPTPNSYRNASGAPGHEYWQQKADYVFHLELDDENQRIYGEETITYHNQSPDVLDYLWLQLDQNVRAKDSDTHLIKNSEISGKATLRDLGRLESDFDGGFKIENVKDTNGEDLKYVVNKTMMRVDPPQSIQPGGVYSFKIKWWYNINNTREIRGRSGYEHFKEDDNNVYVISQFYPRMCLYNDIDGWQNKQFLGRGEFTLTFGDYELFLTVPDDHLVGATGELQNPNKVLNKTQQKRMKAAMESEINPVLIANYDEAEERITGKSKKKKTWHFKADNVRDFGFATSRRFIWDAMGVPMSDGRTVMASSMWVKEGDCLWSKYSTKAVAHTIKWFSHYTVDYPYPVAYSIDGSMGMEYPMICYNFGRCEDDGTYSQRTKYGHIGVIIHEVGHNWFPMIINSDERQWTWMDEGLTTFVQFLTQEHWERNYPARRGPAHKIVDYMGGDKEFISPIMTNSESIHQFGNNAYGKPATALNILRETVMGRELFDMAFKEYCERWMFKHPSPADFFRTMEDASGVDLDWFWRGWFYTNDHCDQSMSDVQFLKLDSQNPIVENARKRAERENERVGITELRNKEAIKETLADKDPSIIDFYSTYDPLEEDAVDLDKYQKYYESLTEEERKVLDENKHYAQLTIKNEGGLVMPVILEFEFADGTTEVDRIPAEIWKLNSDEVTKVFVKDKEIVSITLDPFLETADVDRTNNHFPPQKEVDRFELYQRKSRKSQNKMQKARKAKIMESEVQKP